MNSELYKQAEWHNTQSPLGGFLISMDSLEQVLASSRSDGPEY
jgi:hypothetical protein